MPKFVTKTRVKLNPIFTVSLTLEIMKWTDIYKKLQIFSMFSCSQREVAVFLILPAGSIFSLSQHIVQLLPQS